MSSDTTFGALGVPASLTALLTARGITTPTPIQAATLPDSLAGRDVLGRGRTGSGKTYAFLLPLVKLLDPAITKTQAIIIVPSRELALQIESVFKSMGTNLKVTCCYGGHLREPLAE